MFACLGRVVASPTLWRPEKGAFDGMAIYHANLSYFSRRHGKFSQDAKSKKWVNVSKTRTAGGSFSAVAAASYRAGAILQDHKTAETHDYSRKRGVLTSFLVGGEGLRHHTRESLWNAAEAAERRVDARTAYEFDIALPHELTHDQRIALARQLAQDLVDRYGVAADVSVHLPPADGSPLNHHVHILFSTRRLEADGSFSRHKVGKLEDKRTGPAEVEAIRKQIADRVNDALAAAGHAARVDHRSHKRRGVKEKPGIHEGVNATHARRRGKKAPSSGGQLIVVDGQRHVADWDSIDGGRSRHEYNLAAEAIAAFTAAEKTIQLRQELEASEKALSDRLAAEKFEAELLKAGRVPMPRVLRRRGTKPDEWAMRVFSSLLAQLLCGLVQGVVAGIVMTAMVEQDARRGQEIASLRSHGRQLRRQLKKWEGIAERDQKEAAAAAAAAAAQPAANSNTKVPPRRAAGSAAAAEAATVQRRRRRPQKTWRPDNAASSGRKRRRRAKWQPAAAAGQGPDLRP